MATAERSAEVVWKGDLAHGEGTLMVMSGALAELSVDWEARTERPDGRTSPEELLAAAHATCYAMSLSNVLSEQGHTPEELIVTATCTLDRADTALRISTLDLRVVGYVPGLDPETFAAAARQAEQACSVSNAIRGNVEIHLDARLETRPERMAA